MSNTLEQLPIRFWWGFKRKDVARDQFVATLGDVFVPATVQVMHHRQGALTAYLPIVPPDLGCIDVPDELALVVYKSVEEYNRASETVEGRAYKLLHNSVFGPPSTSGSFPVRFGGEFEAGKAYFLWSDSADWMKAHCTCLVGRRPQGVAADTFLANVGAVLAGLSRGDDATRSPSAVLVRASKNIVTYVEMWTGDSVPNAERSGKVADTLNVLWRSVAAPVFAPRSLNESGKWLNISPAGDFINVQF